MQLVGIDDDGKPNAFQQRFGARPVIDIHVDAGPNRARRVISRLREASARALAAA